MPIRSKNCSDNNSYNEFAQGIITIPYNDTGRGRSSASVGGVRIPWAYKIISAYRSMGFTSGSTTLAVHKNGTAISDVVTASTTASAFTLSASTGSAGDYLGVIGDNGNVATVRGEGCISIVVRPYLGVSERVAAGLGDA